MQKDVLCIPSHSYVFCLTLYFFIFSSHGKWLLYLNRHLNTYYLFCEVVSETLIQMAIYHPFYANTLWLRFSINEINIRLPFTIFSRSNKLLISKVVYNTKSNFHCKHREINPFISRMYLGISKVAMINHYVQVKLTPPDFQNNLTSPWKRQNA